MVVDESVASNGYSTGMPGMDSRQGGNDWKQFSRRVGDLAGDRFGVEAKPATMQPRTAGPELRAASGLMVAIWSGLEHGEQVRPGRAVGPRLLGADGAPGGTTAT